MTKRAQNKQQRTDKAFALCGVIARLFHIHDYRIMYGEKPIGTWLGRPLTKKTKRCIKCGKEKTAHFIGI